MSDWDIEETIPLLIKRCLCFSVKILPHQLYNILIGYKKYKIPSDDLNRLTKEDLEKYTKGLYLVGCEAAGDWTRGLEILYSIGFSAVERTEGHRVFKSVLWTGGGTSDILTEENKRFGGDL